MTQSYFCFGEILWDVIGKTKHLGGAPFNVAAMLAQLGAPSSIISAVGRDTLGDEILAVAKEKRIDTTFVRRAENGLPTGTVKVDINPVTRNATYEIVEPVAWDEIAVPDVAIAAVGQSAALIFGSLAARSAANRVELDRLLATPGPLKFLDVNLRAPFDDLSRVIDLARRVDVLKLNHEEAARLSAFVRNVPPIAPPPPPPPDVAGVFEACAVIAAATGVRRICVTMGAAGAALWDDGAGLHAAAPKVDVKDTVGAGDAFMAGLVIGLSHGVAGQVILDTAVRLGGCIASQHGATPMLPAQMIEDVRATLIGEKIAE